MFSRRGALFAFIVALVPFLAVASQWTDLPQACVNNRGVITFPAAGSTITRNSAVTIQWNYPNGADKFQSQKSSPNGVPYYSFNVHVVPVDAIGSEDYVVASYRLSGEETIQNSIRKIEISNFNLPAGNYYIYVNADCSFNTEELFKIPGCQGPPGCRPCSGWFYEGLAVLEGYITVVESATTGCTLGAMECNGLTQFRTCSYSDNNGNTQWVNFDCGPGTRCSTYNGYPVCGF